MAFEATNKLNSLRNRGQETKTVYIGEDKLEVVLSLINSQEEMGVQEYSSKYEGLAQLLPTKIAILSYAIKGIAGEDLKDKKFIETGEFDTTGKAIRTPRHLFIRSILESWTPSEVDTLFKEYATMVKVSSADTMNTIKLITNALVKSFADQIGADEDLLDSMDDAAKSLDEEEIPAEMPEAGISEEEIQEVTQQTNRPMMF